MRPSFGASDIGGKLKLCASEALVAMLQAYGVKHIFGLPGGNFEFYEAMRSRGMNHVLVRHEHSAAHMADGYARVTRKVGVCDGSAGPGATNLITGLCTARADGIPVIAVLGSRHRSARGRGQFQELDQLPIFRPVCKDVIEIDSAARVPELMRRAFRVATTGRPGPVAVDLPQDVGAELAEFSDTSFEVDARFGSYPPLRISPSQDDVEAILKLLEDAKHPVIWCGGGVLNSGASAEVTALVEHLGIPVVTTYMGKGSLPENHPLCLGPCGATGRPAANQFVKASDMVLVLGSRLTDTDTANWTVPNPGTAIIHVDINPEELGRNHPTRHVVWSDLREFAKAMLQACRNRAWKHSAAASLAREAHEIRRAWSGQFGPEGHLRGGESASPVHPLKVIDALRAAMRPADTLICDSGLNQVYGAKFFEVLESGRTYIGPRGMGTMGFGFPAAVGAKIGRPEGRYVVLCGDGGFAMVLQELETSRRMGAPVTVVVLNNKNLEFIKHGMKARGNNHFSIDYADTRFAAISEAFGCRGLRIENPTGLRERIAEALESPVTTVLEIMTPAEASPFEADMAKAKVPQPA